MNNLPLFILLFFSIPSLASYNNGFDSPPYLLQSDYSENTSNGCMEETYSITSNWNFGTCPKLPQNRTGDGAFMLFDNDPAEPASGKIFFRDIVSTTTGYYKFEIDVNHRNFSWGNYPLREIPLRLYVDNIFITELKIPLQDNWLSLEQTIYFTAGNHTLDLRQDFGPAGPDDDFAIDNIKLSATTLSPNLCDARAVSNPLQILAGTACVFDFLQIYGDMNNAWIWIEVNDVIKGSYLTDGSQEWIDLEDILDLGVELCIGDELKIRTIYTDENGIVQECVNILTLVCCEAETYLAYDFFENNLPNGSSSTVIFNAYGYNGLPSYIKRPQKPDYSTCNNFTSQWCVFESNSPDGNFVLVGSSTATDEIKIPLDPSKYYHIINRSSTPCSDECFLMTVYPNPFNPDEPLVSIIEDFACPDNISCIPTLPPGAICHPVFDLRVEYELLTDIFGNSTIVTCYYLDLVEFNLPGTTNYGYDIYVNGVYRPDNLICCGEDCDWENLTIRVEIDDCDPYILSAEEISGIFVDPNGFRSSSPQALSSNTSTAMKIVGSTLELNTDKAQMATLIIYDTGGRFISVWENLQIHQGFNSIPLEIQDRAQRGMYFISLRGETFQLSKKYFLD